ncbi:MAG: Xaa-Pro peptidase family protein [Treponema sp.]|nr:Xaa-Pro peptidase family protein [Treponema sp.]
MIRTRLDAVCSAMAGQKLDGLIVSDPQSIWYLTGFYTEPYERLFVLYLSTDGRHKFFLNRLFADPGSAVEKIWINDADDGIRIVADNTVRTGRVGIDKNWPARFLLPLMEYNAGVTYVPGSACIDTVRARKDAEEQQLMKAASRINDTCMKRAAEFVQSGITEKQVAEYIAAQFKKEGADGPSFATIVSFGKNAADPHHEPDETIVKPGDCVLIDMGCRKDRYCSDMTRTFYFKTVPEDALRLYEIVRKANETAEAFVKPGVRLCDIDAAARSVITEAGYGPYFTHRLGHFIGQTDHEAGDVSSANTGKAETGMLFSIEPGIYLPGKTGVRIEDLVLVTGSGCEILNKVDKHVKIIG